MSDQLQYRVGAGDVLEIKVLGEEEFSGNFRVSSNGSIDFPYIRKVEVQGKTTESLGKHLAGLLKAGYLTDPQVMVEILEYQSQKVLVLGAVAKPGPYVLKEDTRILDIISRAGGISGIGGKRVLLLREGALPEGEGTEKSVSATSDESGEAKTEVATHQEGIAAKTVDKEIEEPTAPTKEESATTRSFEKVITSRRVRPVLVDYYRLVHEGDFAQNYLLQNGDIINIPKANEIFVLGNVAKPGPIKYEENMTILQAVTLAGGPTPIASTRSTYILRQDQEGEKKVEIRLDKILDNEAKNVVLRADDVIVVPESFF